MNTIKRALGLAVGLFVAVSPELALAQASGAAPGLTDMASPEVTLPEASSPGAIWPGAIWPEVTWPAMAWPAGGAAMAGALAPAEILAEVRREGFYPVGRPVRHGRVYVLFAVDQDDFDVKLTVDAATGQVLWVTGAVARFGGPAYYGYRSMWRKRPPVVPVDSPAAQNSLAAAGTRHASFKRFPPLPRHRPADLASAPARDDAPLAPAPPVRMAPAEP